MHGDFRPELLVIEAHDVGTSDHQGAAEIEKFRVVAEALENDLGPNPRRVTHRDAQYRFHDLTSSRCEQREHLAGRVVRPHRASLGYEAATIHDAADNPRTGDHLGFSLENFQAPRAQAAQQLVSRLPTNDRQTIGIKLLPERPERFDERGEECSG